MSKKLLRQLAKEILCLLEEEYLPPYGKIEEDKIVGKLEYYINAKSNKLNV